MHIAATELEFGAGNPNPHDNNLGGGFKEFENGASSSATMVFCEFDWEFDEVEEFTDKLIEEEELPADQKDEFKNFLKEKVREAKKANREAREARKKAKEEMSAEKKAAFENIRFYKFYPVASPDTPDVSGVKAPFINRYYGKAHHVF